MPAIVEGSFAANIYPATIGSLTVSQFVTPLATQLELGFCFSGGGSRALAATLGQLQPLELITKNGVSLLNQARAMSTVSGGSWTGVPFVYLANPTDEQFLGTYTPPAQLSSSGIKTLSSSLAQQITSHFSIPALAVKALFLYHAGVPTDMLWQTLIVVCLTRARLPNCIKACGRRAGTAVTALPLFTNKH
jgi:hypothetical protein